MDDTPAPPPTPRWHDQPDVLRDLALCDLEQGEVRPTLIAFRDDDPLFVATVRPFPKGGYEQPLTELGVLALMLRATRVALSLSGRAWSTNDPIPPVADGHGDLRQHVLVIHLADASGPQLVRRTDIHPVRVDADGRHRLGEAISADDGVGRVVDMLALMVAPPADAVPSQRSPDVEVLRAALRCQSAGHQLAWGESVARRLNVGLAVLDALDAQATRSAGRAA